MGRGDADFEGGVPLFFVPAGGRHSTKKSRGDKAPRPVWHTSPLGVSVRVLMQMCESCGVSLQPDSDVSAKAGRYCWCRSYAVLNHDGSPSRVLYERPMHGRRGEEKTEVPLFSSPRVFSCDHMFRGSPSEKNAQFHSLHVSSYSMDRHRELSIPLEL